MLGGPSSADLVHMARGMNVVSREKFLWVVLAAGCSRRSDGGGVVKLARLRRSGVAVHEELGRSSQGGVEWLGIASAPLTEEQVSNDVQQTDNDSTTTQDVKLSLDVVCREYRGTRRKRAEEQKSAHKRRETNSRRSAESKNK